MKIQATCEEDDSQIVVAEEGLDDVNDEPPLELVNEITNQQVVQAHRYVRQMKRLRNTFGEEGYNSIFDRDDFELNLSCKPTEDQ